MKLGILTERIAKSRVFRRRIDPVLRLFLTRCPAAVAQFVIAIVVVALNAILTKRALAHVGKKVSEFLPSVTQCNSTPSISMEMDGLRVGTALHHRKPGTICARWSASIAASVAVLKLLSRGSINFASTISGKPIYKAGTNHYHLVTAVTSALPRWFVVLSKPSPGNNKPRREAFASNVCSYFHKQTILHSALFIHIGVQYGR